MAREDNLDVVGYLSIEARRRIAAVILILAVVVVVLAITDSAIFEDEATAEERVAAAVEDFFESASAGDFERDCELLTKEAEALMRRGAERLLAEEDKRLDCAEILETVVGDSFADVSVRVRSVNISGNRARAEAVLKPEGEISSFRTILLEEDDGGGWLISDFG